MKIVLLEELGIANSIIEYHQNKLAQMGHVLKVYSKQETQVHQENYCQDADVIMLANMPLDAKVIETATNLKYIDVAFTGVDHIPMELAASKNIQVSNASGYATQAVSELCISFMIQLLRKIKETEQQCRSQGTKDGLVGSLLNGKTVGIIGAGAIGKKTAALTKAFGCKVITYSRSKVTDPVFDQQVTLEELLQNSDIVSLHCPLTKETENMIGQKQLNLMKKTAILINTARGKVVDSSALAKALNSGDIAGAAIDVFETEPPIATTHPLLNCRNTIVTPHIAFASRESMEQRAEIVFDNLYAWLAGKPKNLVG